MKIFIGMETSGVSRRAFAALGHDVISCDLLPAQDGATSGRHIVGDVFEALEKLKAAGWWPRLALFHPECTYHTVSAAWAFLDPNFERYPGVGYHQKVKPSTLVGQARRDARKAAEADVRQIWALDIECLAIENPVGTLSTRWQQPTQIIQPNWFGHDASKATCLWLRKLPALVGTSFFPPRMVCDDCRGRTTYLAASKGCRHCGAEAAHLKPRWANQTDTGQNRLSPGADRWQKRSDSYPGIFNAAALQWTATGAFA